MFYTYGVAGKVMWCQLLGIDGYVIGRVYAGKEEEEEEVGCRRRGGGGEKMNGW